tara:strand:+ start:105 stop:557 length:453 start_codon:yes stop_codon:yes gene_type:complete
MFQPRKLYESDTDLDNELSLIDHLYDKHNYGTLVKLPMKFKIDYAELGYMIGDGCKSIVSLIELKHRTCTKGQYSSYMLSADKFKEGLQYTQNFNVSFRLIVKWIDSIGCYTMKKNDYFSLGFNGRYDRGDWQDVEPVVYIPIKEFENVS